jgi:hypothetical protein
MTKRSHAKPAPKPIKSPHRTPVNVPWLKFVDEFLAFHKMRANEDDKQIHKAWERALRGAGRAAEAVTVLPATCLREMELKIQAWAFTSPVKTNSNIVSLSTWHPTTARRTARSSSRYGTPLSGSSGLCGERTSRSAATPYPTD